MTSTSGRSLREAAALFGEPGKALFQRDGAPDRFWLRCSTDDWFVGGDLFRLSAEEQELTFEFAVIQSDVVGLLTSLKTLLVSMRSFEQHSPGRL